MSRVYWHTPRRTAELRGSERAWLAHVARGPANAAWDLDPMRSHALSRAVTLLGLADGQHHLGDALDRAVEHDRSYRAAHEGGHHPVPRYDPEPLRNLIVSLNTALRVNGLTLDVAGVQLYTANLDLNTALAAGSDPVRLAAKIHGWCESHAWVEGPERGWLAGIIEQALTVGLYRRGIRVEADRDGDRDMWVDQGWNEVLDLLRDRDDEPVVLSYSVCDEFPSPEMAGMADDGWDDVAFEEQWRLAMDGLRTSRPWARLAPDTLAEVTFGPALTVYDLWAPDRDDRVRAAAGDVGRGD